MTDVPKVVSLRGEEIVSPGAPVAAVITSLEEILEMARSGEVKGFAIALVHQDDCTSMCRTGVQTRGLIGCLEILKTDLCEACR